MRFAFVFPGQGSQTVGMLAPFAQHPAARQVLDRAGMALGEDLAGLIDAGPAEQLNLTVHTQPAMLAAGLAVYAVWRAEGGRPPDVMAGHSLGEYTALAAAGALTLEDAVRLVRFRATAMQEAVPAGAGTMAAILGLTDEQVRQACAEGAQGEVVEAVNFNAPAQVVIAGHRSAVERACEAARRLGAKRAIVLPVSAPFHCSLLQPASHRLRERLASVPLAPPSIPVVNNVDVTAERDPDRIRDALARQAAQPVRWTEVVRAFGGFGVTHVVECGPGKVLAGLTRRIDPGLHSLSIGDADGLRAALAQLKE